MKAVLIKRKRFTLVELLVVIAIIGVLAAILRPFATVGIFDGQTGGHRLKFKGRWTVFAKRHQKGGNILFLDWHVKWYSRKHVKSDVRSENPHIIWLPADREDLERGRGS